MTKRWQDWTTLILGVWLFLSPWILGFTGISQAATNAYVIGIAVVVFALLALYMPHLWEEWINVVLGVWLIVSPWVLGYAGVMQAAVWNSVIVGLLVAIFGLWAIVQVQRHRITMA